MQLDVKPIYEFGEFCLKVADRQLKRNGAPVALTPKLFDLLVFLLENSGRAISKDELLNKVWPDSFVSEENLSRHISMLRKTLGEDSGGQRCIETLPKFGYRFAEQVRRIEGPAEPIPAQTPIALSNLPGELASNDALAKEIFPIDPPAMSRPAAVEENLFPTELEQNFSPAIPAPAKRRNSIVLAALVLSLIALLAAIFVIYRLTRQSSDSAENAATPKIAPFTSYVNRENYPAFSPDDKMLAFTWDGQQGNNIDIYVKLLDAETPLRLTTDPAADISPTWSPDGRFLAFVRIFADGKAGIYLVPTLGGPERELVTDIWSAGTAVPAGRLAWSPDSKFLVFAGRTDQAETQLHLFLYDFEKQEKRQLTNSSEDDRMPVFSPDGKTLAFIRGLDEIYVMPAAGAAPRQLTFDNRRIFGLAWLAQGNELIFSSARAGNPTLWKVAATGGTPQALTPGGEQVGNLAISHDGKRLAYVQNIRDSNIWQLEVPDSQSPPKAPTPLIVSTRLEMQPGFSSDGKHIAFVSTRSGWREIWMSDSAGHNLVQLTRFNGPFVGSPKFSPDGKQIAFDCTAENDQRDIYVVGITGGTPRRLTTDNANESEPFWSHDGQWIYFCLGLQDSEQIWKIPAAGGAAVQVTQRGGRHSAESPDGKYLYFSRKPDEPGIWRKPTAGGEEKLILPQGRTGNWAIGEQGIYVINPTSKPRPTLELFRFASEQISLLATLEKWTFADFAVSPDGRKISWSQIDRNESDLILIDNFR
ncbi:MAG: PD40 domain-containing protein [Acidobacteria bacterium]|nr:PD40 domain-containing protein [Acidobacteriota bacterium]